MKKFKSIHIDLEKGIYKINDEEIERVSKLEFVWTPYGGYVLDITEDKNLHGALLKERSECK